MSAPATKKVTKPKKPAEHPTYAVMIAAAIAGLKDRTGSSRQAILKYICANYKVDAAKAAVHLRLALKSGVAKGSLKMAKESGKGAGSYKLAEKPKKENYVWVKSNYVCLKLAEKSFEISATLVHLSINFCENPRSFAQSRH